MRFGWLIGLALSLTWHCASFAQENKKVDDDKPADPDTGESTVEETTLGLLPNPFDKYGVKFAATYIGGALGNTAGGLRQGAIYEGRLNLAVDADLQRLVGLQQLTFHANMFQIHGGGLSRDNLQNFMVVSGVEALPSTRLYEIWFEQKWGKDQVSLKAGQLAADSEFSTPSTRTSSPTPRWAGRRSPRSICQAAVLRRPWPHSARVCAST